MVNNLSVLMTDERDENGELLEEAKRLTKFGTIKWTCVAVVRMVRSF